MVAIMVPEECVRCGEKLGKNYSTVTFSSPFRKTEEGIEFPYSWQYYLCKECVGDFDEWIKDYLKGGSG